MARKRREQELDCSLEEHLLEVAAGLIRPLNDEVQSDREQCEQSLYYFVQQAWNILEPANPFSDNWHVGCICEHLQAVTDLQIRNLIINIPPRCGKSICVCVGWFAWVWAKLPSTRWIYGSNEEKLSLRDAKKCLDLIESPWYQERWQNSFSIRQNDRAISRFTNDKTGYRIATSVSGRGVGEGADVVVFDDPNKPKEIYYDSHRKEVIRWWNETMSTRGDNPQTSRRVGIMQRLHDLDLAGYLKSADLGYEFLILPMEYEPKRYLLPTPGQPPIRDAITPTALQQKRPELLDPRKEEGELLWPTHFTLEEVSRLKKHLGSYGTSGQFQQRPSPEQGEVFRRSNFHYFTEEAILQGDQLVTCFILQRPDDEPILIPVKDCFWFQTVDTAMTENAESNYTAVLTCCSAPWVVDNQIKSRFLLIYNVDREKLAIPSQFQWVTGFRTRYHQVAFQAVEPKQSGIGLIQQGMAEGKPFRVLTCKGGKIQRAGAATTMYEAGLIYHRLNMPLLGVMEDELASFPSGQTDDICDTLSYAAQLFTEEKIVTSDYQGELLIDETEPQVVRGGEVYVVNGREVYFPDDPEWYAM